MSLEDINRKIYFLRRRFKKLSKRDQYSLGGKGIKILSQINKLESQKDRILYKKRRK